MDVARKNSSQKQAATLERLKREIAERKDVTKALKKSEHHYEQLLKESCRMQEQLRYVTHQTLLAHEEERKKISREMHNEIGQILAQYAIDGIKG